MASSVNIRPPLKHTPFDTTTPDGTPLVSNEWYDWALNMKKAIDSLRTIVEDPNGVSDDVTSLLTAEVTVFARDMLPTATGGCSALTVIELAAGQPNFHGLLFDKTARESADFHCTLPFSWAGKAFRVYVYWAHGAGATAYNVTWEVTANCTGDNESLILDFVGGAIIYDTGGTAGNLYIAALSDPVPISRAENRDGDLVSVRIYRNVADPGDTLDIDAVLLAVRFALTDEAFPSVDPPAEFDADWDNVVLLVQGGTVGSTTINDLSIYADTATISANASWTSAQQVFGANTIRNTTIGPTITPFDGDETRFGRPSSEDMTIEAFFRFNFIENYSESFPIWFWVKNGQPDRLAELYVQNYFGVPHLWMRQGATGADFGVVTADTTYFTQLTVVGNTYYLDLGTVGGGSTTQIGTGAFVAEASVGTYYVYVSAGWVPSSLGTSQAAWTGPVRWTKGVARARGTVPTGPFATSGEVASGSGGKARWFENNAYTTVSNRDPVLPAGRNCIATFYSSSDQVGVAHVSSWDGTNTQVARSGKVYLEFRFGANDGNFVGVLANTGFTAGFVTTADPFGTAGYYCIHNIDYRSKSIGLITNGTASANSSYDWSATDIIGMAIDWATGKMWFSKNGTWISGDPAAGTSPTFTLASAAFTIVGGAYTFSTGIQVIDLRAKAGETVSSPPTGFTWYA